MRICYSQNHLRFEEAISDADSDSTKHHRVYGGGRYTNNKGLFMYEMKYLVVSDNEWLMKSFLSDPT